MMGATVTDSPCAHLFERFRRWPVKDRWRCNRLNCGFVTRAYDSADQAAGRPVHPHMSVVVVGFNTIADYGWSPWGWWAERRLERQAARLLMHLQVESFLHPERPWMTTRDLANAAGIRDSTQFVALARLERRGAIERRTSDTGASLYRYCGGSR